MAINSQNGSTLLESGFFPPCRLATTGSNLALSGLGAIDGVTPIAGDRILVKNQTDATTNGIYAASSGNWVRTADAASNSQFFDGMAVIVAQGTVNGGLTFLCTTTDDPVVIGTSLLTFLSQQAVANALQQATSTSSAALTTGAKTFATQAGKSFAAKQWLLIQETANPNNNLLAQITSYSGTSLVVSVVATAGSGGPFTDWTIVLTNTPAAAGLQPPTGTGNVTGPGSAVDSNIAVFDGTTGKLVKDSGKTAGTLAARNTLQFGDAGTKSIGPASLADGAAPLPFVAAQPADNLTLAIASPNPNIDIQITAGRVRDIDDTTNLQLAAAMLKRIDTAWAAGGSAGNPQGMLLSGSSWLASKTYHIWLIGKIGLSATQRSRTSNVATLTVAGHGLGVGATLRVIGVGGGYDGVVAITAVAVNTISYANTAGDEGLTAVSGATVDGFDIGATQNDAQAYPAATLPSGWTTRQCLGSILTDGSKNVRSFTQCGDLFEYSTVVSDVADTNPGNSALAKTLTVPAGVSVLAWFMATLIQTSTLGGVGLRVTALDSGDDPPSTSNSDVSVGESQVSAQNFTANAAAQCWVRTTTGAQIRSRVNNSTANLQVLFHTRGWRDLRRRLF